MELYDEWQQVKKINSTKKTLAFLKQLVSNRPAHYDENEIGLLGEIFEEFTSQLMRTYENSQVRAFDKEVENLEILILSNSSSITKQYLCQFYNIIGTYFRKSSKNKQALRFFEKGVSLAEKSQKPALVHCYLNLNLCGVLSDQANHVEALKFARLAVNYSQELLLQANTESENKEEMIEAVCISYHTLGTQEEYLKNFSTACEWYDKAFKFAQKNLGQNREELIKTLFSSFKSLESKIKSEKSSRPFTAKSTSLTKTDLSVKNNIASMTGSNRIRANSNQFASTNQNFRIKTLYSENQAKSISKLQEFRVSQAKISGAKTLKRFNVPKPKNSALEVPTSTTPFDVAEHENVLENIGRPFNSKSSKFSSLNNSLNKSPILPERTELPVVPAKNNLYSSLITKSIQTESVKDLEKQLTEIQGVKENTGSKKANINLQIQSPVEIKNNFLHKALVKSYTIEIMNRQYEVKYFINSSLDILFIEARNESHKCELKYKTDPQIPILDLIQDKLHPYITIVGGNLEISTVPLRDLKEKPTPVKIDKEWENTKASEIEKPQTITTAKSPEKALGPINPEKTIETEKSVYNMKIENKPSSNELQTTSLPKIEENLAKPVIRETSEKTIGNSPIKTSEKTFEKSPSPIKAPEIPPNIEKFLSNPSPLLFQKAESVPNRIHSPVLEMKKFKSTPQDVEKAALTLQSNYRGFLVRKKMYNDVIKSAKKSIGNQDFEIRIIDSISTRTLKITITDGVKTCSKTFVYPVPFPSPFEVTIPKHLVMHNKCLAFKNPNTRKYIYLESPEDHFSSDSDISSISDEPGLPGVDRASLYNRIIYRTCINKNDKIYQISMSLIKSPKDDDILVFLIRHGSTVESTQKFSIDVKTICEKAKLDKKNIVVIGDYVVRHFLVLGDNDISYIDFSKPETNNPTSIVKLQALIRGLLIRKRVNFPKKMMIFKKKINIEGNKWTLMLFADSKQFYLKMVKGIEVIAVELNLMLIARDGNLADIDTFAKKVIIPNIKIVSNNQRLSIVGLEKYTRSA